MGVNFVRRSRLSALRRQHVTWWRAIWFSRHPLKNCGTKERTGKPRPIRTAAAANDIMYVADAAAAAAESLAGAAFTQR